MAEYMEYAVAARPTMLARATYFAAHPYPANEWAPLHTSDNLPVAMGGHATWMAELRALRLKVGASWLTNRSHTREALVTATGFRLLGTETGFGGSDEVRKASDYAELYTKLWNPDPVVAGIVPFLLAGRHWDSYGFSWADFSGSKTALKPTYIAIQTIARSKSVTKDNVTQRADFIINIKKKTRMKEEKS